MQEPQNYMGECLECGGLGDAKFYLDYALCVKCFEDQKKVLKEYKDSRTTFYPEINPVVEGLCIGNQDGACDWDMLKQHGITHIVRAGYELDSKFEGEIKYLKLDLNDALAQPIKPFFKQSNEFIANAIKEKGVVLVHCYAGVSRSSTLTIAYLMMSKSMKVNEAIQFLKSKRSAIHPNSRFIADLRLYES